MAEHTENEGEDRASHLPIFSLIAGATLFLCLFTPYLLLTLPVMATVALAIVGAVRREKPIWLPYVLGGVGIVLVLAAQSQMRFGTTGSGATSESTASNAKLYKDAQWEYGSAKDEMRGSISKWATLDSPTDLNLSSPYDGANNAHIQTSETGELILEVTKGQFICHTDGTVSLKFDNGPIYQYPCQEAGNGNSNTIYVNTAYSPEAGQPQTAVAGILRAKRMMIEAEFYQDGPKQIVFNVAGLDKTKI